MLCLTWRDETFILLIHCCLFQKLFRNWYKIKPFLIFWTTLHITVKINLSENDKPSALTRKEKDLSKWSNNKLSHYPPHQNKLPNCPFSFWNINRGWGWKRAGWRFRMWETGPWWWGGDGNWQHTERSSILQIMTLHPVRQREKRGARVRVTKRRDKKGRYARGKNWSRNCFSLVVIFLQMMCAHMQLFVIAMRRLCGCLLCVTN